MAFFTLANMALPFDIRYWIAGAPIRKSVLPRAASSACRGAAPVALIWISMSGLYFWTSLAKVVLMANGVGRLIVDIR